MLLLLGWFQIDSVTCATLHMMQPATPRCFVKLCVTDTGTQTQTQTQTHGYRDTNTQIQTQTHRYTPLMQPGCHILGSFLFHASTNSPLCSCPPASPPPHLFSSSFTISFLLFPPPLNPSLSPFHHPSQPFFPLHCLL